MTVNSSLVKNLLRTYDKQLVSARRLARYRQTLQSTGVQDTVSISREAKRRQLVQRVAHEIVENLLVNGSKSSIVKEIKQSLEAEFQTKLLLRMSPEKGEVQVLRQIGKETEQVPEQEKNRIMARLWQITLSKVDQTML